MLHAWRARPRSLDYVDSGAPAAADRGSAVHALLFGEDRITVIAAEDYRTNAAKEARDAARASGRVPVLVKEMDAIAEMMEPARIRFRYLHGGDFLCEQGAWRDRTATASGPAPGAAARRTGKAAIVRHQPGRPMEEANYRRGGEAGSEAKAAVPAHPDGRLLRNAGSDGALGEVGVVSKEAEALARGLMPEITGRLEDLAEASVKFHTGAKAAPRLRNGVKAVLALLEAHGALLPIAGSRSETELRAARPDRRPAGK